MSAPRFLLDTNILSEVTKPQPNSAVMEKLEQYTRSIATTAVTLHELSFGCYWLPPSKQRQKLEEYISTLLATSIPIFSYDLTAAQWHASERARLTSLGRAPSFIDGQIAAIAVINDLTLITNNTSDYTDFQNLQLQNWFIA